MKRYRRSVFLLLGLIVALGVLIFALANRREHPKPVTSYGLDSFYEVRRAEDEASSVIDERQEKYERRRHEPLESEPGREATHCVLDPPPPAADRLVCSAVRETRELYATEKVARVYRWKATVDLDPHTGALSVDVHGPTVGPPKITP